MDNLFSFTELLSREVRRPDSSQKVIDYITNPKRTGREFERYQNINNDPNRITPADLISISLLSVRIAENSSSLKPTSILLLDENSIASQISDELRRIPSDLCIEDAHHDLYLECVERSRNIWRILKENADVNSPVARYKLLARKRPLLFPIRDSVLNTALQMRNSKEWYVPWFEAFHDPEFEIKQDLLDIREEVERELDHKIEYGLLRIADMVIWERWTKICELCLLPVSNCIECDGSGFQEANNAGTYFEPYPCFGCSGWNGDPDSPDNMEYWDFDQRSWIPGVGLGCETEGCPGSKGFSRFCKTNGL